MNCQRRTDTSFACPVVGERELYNRQKLHREKVRTMTSCLDTKPPAPQPHLTLYGRDYVAKKRATTEAAFSDLKMIQSMARTMTRKQELPDRKGPTSLNADSRRNEINRIMKENHRLLGSLETLKPTINSNKMIEEHTWKKRYTVLSSHTKRRTGEYDAIASQHLAEDNRRLESLRRSTDHRKAMQSTMQNSNAWATQSMPNIPRAQPAGNSTDSPVGASSSSNLAASMPSMPRSAQPSSGAPPPQSSPIQQRQDLGYASNTDWQQQEARSGAVEEVFREMEVPAATATAPPPPAPAPSPPTASANAEATEPDVAKSAPPTEAAAVAEPAAVVEVEAAPAAEPPVAAVQEVSQPETAAEAGDGQGQGQRQPGSDELDYAGIVVKDGDDAQAVSPDDVPK